MKEHESMADQYYGSLDLAALAEKLEGAQVDDPDKPGEKVSRLKLLMRHEAAKIRARMNGSSAPVRQVVQHQRQPERQETMAELMDRARTFGGGGV